jgi:short-subunit dehydrogenase involved in D-alanine esterification of teichoic acids
MAEKFISAGSKVIVVGRRKDRLDAFVAKHGSDKADAVAFDATDASGVAKFAETVSKKHPDLDCVFLNQGMSRHHDFSQADKEYDLETFHQETELNFTSFVNLTHAFLPLLRAKKTATTIT